MVLENNPSPLPSQKSFVSQEIKQVEGSFLQTQTYKFFLGAMFIIDHSFTNR